MKGKMTDSDFVEHVLDCEKEGCDLCAAFKAGYRLGMVDGEQERREATTEQIRRRCMGRREPARFRWGNGVGGGE